MKILFLNSKSPDYVEDQLFSALTEIFGKQAISAYPANYRYYLGKKLYPLNMGRCRNASDLIRDKWVIKKTLKAFDYDYVIIGSTKRDTFECFFEISDYLPKNIPVIYVDGGDCSDIGGDATRLCFKYLFDSVTNNFKFKYIFKREYLIDKAYPDNVYPYPMAFKPQNIDVPIQKQYDVTCWCVESDPVRTQALSILDGMYDCRSNGTTLGQTFRSYERKGLGYLKALGSSRISCNFRGVGWDTLRYWEIPAVQTLMLCQKPKIVIPNNFVNGEHVIFCKDDLSDMTDLIDYYLSHSDEREEMSVAARDFIMKKHTHIKRAEYFLQKIGER